jgi:hypothetical protein
MWFSPFQYAYVGTSVERHDGRIGAWRNVSQERQKPNDLGTPLLRSCAVASAIIDRGISRSSAIGSTLLVNAGRRRPIASGEGLGKDSVGDVSSRGLVLDTSPQFKSGPLGLP